MPPVRVTAAQLDDAADPVVEFWVGDDLLAVTFLYDGRLHLRIAAHPDGEPWQIESASLALALDRAARQITGD